LEESLNHLKLVPSLKEIYFTGNPCTDWKSCRELTIALCEQIQFYDGKDVLHSERILAKQNLNDLLIDLNTEIEMKKFKEATNPIETNENSYTRENRRKMYLEMAQEKEAKEKKKNPEKFEEKKKESTMYYPNGEARQCNEGKYEYKLLEWDDPEYTFFEIKVPKYMDTSLIDVNLQPKLVSIRIKGKLTQLRLNDEIQVEKSEVTRSQVTGMLHIKMPKVEINQSVATLKKKDNKENQKEKENISQSQLANTKEDKTSKTKEEAKTNKKPEKKIDYTLDDIPDLE